MMFLVRKICRSRSRAYATNWAITIPYVDRPLPPVRSSVVSFQVIDRLQTTGEVNELKKEIADLQAHNQQVESSIDEIYLEKQRYGRADTSMAHLISSI